MGYIFHLRKGSKEVPSVIGKVESMQVAKIILETLGVMKSASEGWHPLLNILLQAPNSAGMRARSDGRVKEDGFEFGHEFLASYRIPTLISLLHACMKP